jgi:hypothetical protein
VQRKVFHILETEEGLARLYVSKLIKSQRRVKKIAVTRKQRVKLRRLEGSRASSQRFSDPRRIGVCAFLLSM